VQFGKDLFGVKKAAQFYFHKSPRDLNLVESSFLAILLPSPEKYSRSYFRKELTGFARKRMNFVIKNLYKASQISETEYNDAMAQLSYFPNTPPPPEPEELKLVDDDAVQIENGEIGADTHRAKKSGEASDRPITIEDLENMKIEEN
jgi:monofunctional biosynthetic peptidoglycan transglycosylase